MPSEIEQLEKEDIPRSARLITEARRGRLRIPAIPVRQEADEAPKFIRSRFGWSIGEVSGSLGDLGTFLPHIVGQLLGIGPLLPVLDFGWHFPQLVIPSWAQIVHGTQNAVLPQIPLTLTNAIIVTAAVSRQLFPKELHPVNERNLAITTGLGNLLAAPCGGYLMCHGAGGIAGHVRFGARTATARYLSALRLSLSESVLAQAAMRCFGQFPTRC